MLSTNDYKGILDLIEIIHNTSDRALMFKVFCEGLHQLVPICSAAYAPFDEKKTGFEFPGSLMYNLQSQPLHLFAEYYASKQPYLIAVTDEGVAKYLNKATNLTDVISPRRLKDSEYGTDFQPVAGVFYESCVILGTQGDSLGTMGLHRPRGDRDFSSREKRIVNHLLPHLARSFHLLGLTQGRFPSTENGELVFAEDGQPLSMNDEAKRILAGRPPSALPSVSVGRQALSPVKPEQLRGPRSPHFARLGTTGGCHEFARLGRHRCLAGSSGGGGQPRQQVVGTA